MGAHDSSIGCSTSFGSGEMYVTPVTGQHSLATFYTDVPEGQRNAINVSCSSLGKAIPIQTGAMRKKAPAILYSTPGTASNATSYNATTLR